MEDEPSQHNTTLLPLNMMSYSQSFSNYNFNNNEKADDSSSTVFDADTVAPDEVPSLPPASQEESPQSFTSVLLRRINSTRHHPTMPSTTTTATATPTVYDANTVIPGREESPATAARSEELSRSNQHQSKRPIITNSASHSSRKKTRQSSRRKRQRSQDQSCVDKSDSEVDDENGHEDYESDEAVINQSSPSSQISTKRQRQNELKWKSKFEKLCDYERLHGHTNVPKSNKQLGQWVIRQRTEYKKFKKNNGKAHITKERIAMLESIDFKWVSPIKGGQRNESVWIKRFNELKAYKENNGHMNVSTYDEDNKQLGNWVQTQRTQYKKFQENGKGKITLERIQKLESIDFEWVSQTTKPRNESAWNKRFTELKEYKEEYGHTNVSRYSKDNKELGDWVSTQRHFYKMFIENKKSQITPERIELLESIDFEWEGPETRFEKDESAWNKRFNELKAYKEKYGRTNVPRSKNKQLGMWVSKQRVEYKNFKKNEKSQITPERVDLLNSIGFQWVVPDKGAPRNESKWNERFNELKEYKKNNGHTNVSTHDEDNKQLGTWVNTQRHQYRKFKENKKSFLTLVRIDLLNSIGFQWEVCIGRPACS